METIVFFHAHPDDEVLVTGGTIARAVDEGYRTVLVVATNGDHGERPDDLAASETIVDRRRQETERSAAILGLSHVLWLGYGDSGMTGWEQNDHPESFWSADVDEAGGRLAKLLDAEQATALVTYDWHGVYGHPDHVQAHRVGRRGAEIAGTPRVLEATMNRDALVVLADAAGEAFDPDAISDDGNPFGTAESEIHWVVDVRDYVARKRAALACHASQVSDVGEMLAMPEEYFALSFGREWFIEPGRPPGLVDGWPFGQTTTPPASRQNASERDLT